eukprot:1298516-Rhodomonas_salina.1
MRGTDGGSRARTAEGLSPLSRKKRELAKMRQQVSADTGRRKRKETEPWCAGGERVGGGKGWCVRALTAACVRARVQMRASLQQTQNKMMAGTPASTDARASSVQAGGAPGGVAPMVVSRAGLASAGPLRRQPSGSGRSPGRPASQQASREG